MSLGPDLDKDAPDTADTKISAQAVLKRAEQLFWSVPEAKTPADAIKICNEVLALYQQASQDADNSAITEQARQGVAKALSQRGHQQRYAHNYAEAIKDLGQALEFDPTLTDDLYYRALSYLRIGNQAGAKRDFSDYIKRGDDEFLKRLAWERRESLMPKKAEGVATLEYWRNQGTHFNGEATNVLHPKDEAAPDYTAAIAFYNKALEAFDKVLELAPEDKMTRIYKLAALKGQAQCYAQIAEYDLAIADYNQVLQLQPTPQHLFERGEAYRAAGQDGLARTDFEEFLKSGPSISALARQQAQQYLAEKSKDGN